MDTPNRQTNESRADGYDAFARYANRDHYAVRGLIKDLERGGDLSVWIYERVKKPGSKWREEVSTALHDAASRV